MIPLMKEFQLIEVELEYLIMDLLIDKIDVSMKFEKMKWYLLIKKCIKLIFVYIFFRGKYYNFI